jgi:two-component system NarL family sensor kinase
LSFEAARVRMRVSDDGVGFDSRSLARMEDGHFGWRGICERAEQIRADVELTSQPGQGTTVLVTVPIT